MMGHFGVQRTIDRLKKDYWWRGMGDTVIEVIKACLPCARVKAGFSEPGKELQPLPVRGLGYRWGVHFARPLETTVVRCRMRYIRVPRNYPGKPIYMILSRVDRDTYLTMRCALSHIDKVAVITREYLISTMS